MRVTRLLVILCSLVFLVEFDLQPVFGQSGVGEAPPGSFADPNTPSGQPDPFKPDGLWTVNKFSGALNVKIPVPTTPSGGRGPHIPFVLLYNSAATVTLQFAGTVTGSGTLMKYQWASGTLNTPNGPVGPWTTSGPFVRSTTTIVPDYTPRNLDVQMPTVQGCSVIGPILYADEEGETHDLNLADGGGPTSQYSSYCQAAYNSRVYTGGTTDGSNLQSALRGGIGTYVLNGQSPTLLYPNGSAYFQGPTLEDTNGNVTSQSKDALGRTPFTTNFPIGFAGVIPVGVYSLSTVGTTGQTEPYSIAVSAAPIGGYTMPHPQGNSEMCCWPMDASGGVTGYAVPLTSGSTVNVVTKVNLPNGAAYDITYDITYGTISKITLPTGGYVRFTYGINPLAAPHSDATSISSVVVTDVYTSDISDGTGSESHWHYQFAPYSDSTAFALTSTVTAPDGSYTNHTGKVGRETQQLIYDKSGKLLRSVSTTFPTYQFAEGTTPGGVATDYFTPPFPEQVTTTSYDGSSPIQTVVRDLYDMYNNVVEHDQSDFISCSGAPCADPTAVAWARKSFTSFWHQNSALYVQAHIVNKPSQVLVTDGSGHPAALSSYAYDEVAVTGPAGLVGHDDINFGTASTNPRGNLTSEKHCQTLTATATVTPATASTACTQWQPASKHTYDLTGQVLSSTDAKGNTTTYSYLDSYGSSGNSLNSFLMSATSPQPLSFAESYTYYPTTGQVKTHTDWNQQTTTYSYPDNLNRLRTVQRPDTGTTTVDYSDTAPSWSMSSTTTTGNAAGSLIQSTTLDGLGRVIRSSLTSDSAGADVVDTKYNAMGQKAAVSNPYHSSADATYGWTSFSYDSLGRTTFQCQPDNGTVAGACSPSKSYLQWSYAGNTVTSWDEIRRSWMRASDGLGRLISVIEPGSLATTYTYDVLGSLKCADQWGATSTGSPCTSSRTRRFTYDALSRLLTSFNPEAGTICYGLWSGGSVGSGTCQSGYDANGNIVAKTDARNVATQYAYDTLNRLSSKTYTNDGALTSSACFQYDGTASTNQIGRLTSEWTQKASIGACSSSLPSSSLTHRIVNAYDPLGRILSESQCLGSSCSTNVPGRTTYSYDLAGHIATFGDLLGTRLFTNSYDAAGHLSSITASPVGGAQANLFSSPTYAAFGGLTSATYGTSLNLTRAYDSRLRPTKEIDTGFLPQGPSVPSSVSILVGGGVQSK